jgi:hypothetical protein
VDEIAEPASKRDINVILQTAALPIQGAQNFSIRSTDC